MTVRSFQATEIEMKHLSWLLFGPSGSGKTVLIGTFPTPIAVIDPSNERGSTTLRGHPDARVWQPTTPAEVDESLAEIIRGKYRTIAFDGLTMFLEMLYNAKMEKKKTVEQSDWFKWGGEILRMIEKLRNVPAEKVYTAGVTTLKDGTVGPALFNWLTSRLPHKMEAVIYMDCITDVWGTPTFRAHLSGSGSIIGRVRGSMPGGMVPMPDYAMLLKVLSEPIFASGDAKPRRSQPIADTATATALPVEEAIKQAP